MRSIFLFLMILVIMPACSEKRPVANLKFVHAANGFNHIKFYYQSDTNLDQLFDPEAMRKVVTKRLLCALADDQNFDVKHIIERYGEGDVLQEGNSDGATFEYLSPVYFFQTDDKDTTRNYIDGEALRFFLLQREKIPCKVVMTVYMSNPYYSATMWVPSSEILRVLPQGFPKPLNH